MVAGEVGVKVKGARGMHGSLSVAMARLSS